MQQVRRLHLSSARGHHVEAYMRTLFALGREVTPDRGQGRIDWKSVLSLPTATSATALTIARPFATCLCRREDIELPAALDSFAVPSGTTLDVFDASMIKGAPRRNIKVLPEVEIHRDVFVNHMNNTRDPRRFVLRVGIPGHVFSVIVTMPEGFQDAWLASYMYKQRDDAVFKRPLRASLFDLPIPVGIEIWDTRRYGSVDTPLDVSVDKQRMAGYLARFMFAQFIPSKRRKHRKSFGSEREFAAAEKELDILFVKWVFAAADVTRIPMLETKTNRRPLYSMSLQPADCGVGICYWWSIYWCVRRLLLH